MNTTLSIRNANILFLFSIGLVLTVGSVVQLLDLSLGLIATEVLLILLPAILFLRRRRIPLKEGLLLHPISPQTAVLSILLGFTTFLFSVYIEMVMIDLTGMLPVTLPEGSLPTGVLDSILYFIALSVSAPICEEILFRGAIQSAYEKRRTVGFTITITALMFAFYHFRLTGLPGLIPVAFILGYVAWRTRSIYASMLVHFGMNATSAANTLVAIHLNETGLPLISPWMAVTGLAVSALLILLLRHMHPAPEPASISDIPVKAGEPSPSWLGNYWPVLIAGTLYLGVAGLTLAAGLSPELLATTEMTYNPPTLESEIDSRYRITNRAGEVVGEMDCTLSAQADALQLECSRRVDDYEVQLENSYFSDIAHTASWTAAWDAASMGLQAYTYERHDETGTGLRSEYQDGLLTTVMGESTMAADMESSSLVEYEWAWRAGALEAVPGDIRKVEYVYLTRWDDTAGKSITTRQTEILEVTKGEDIRVPAGEFSTRKLSVGHQTVWYPDDTAGFPIPVRFDDGMLFYALEE